MLCRSHINEAVSFCQALLLQLLLYLIWISVRSLTTCSTCVGFQWQFAARRSRVNRYFNLLIIFKRMFGKQNVSKRLAFDNDHIWRYSHPSFLFDYLKAGLLIRRNIDHCLWWKLWILHKKILNFVSTFSLSFKAPWILVQLWG